MQRKNILISILMTLILILFAVFLYGFTYHTINKRFFDASVTHTIETMQVMRDLGIQTVEHNLRDLKTNLQHTASQNSNQLVKGTYNERVTILSQLQLPQDGIDYWYCTPQGKVVTAKGLILDWKLKTDLNAVFSSGETVVIDPYFDESGNYILSIAAPLRQNGQVVALLLVRLNGYCISKWIEDIQFQTGEGLAYIISGDGRNIATSRKKNYDWITSEYNSLELMDADEESKSVADLEGLPLEGKTGWGTYQWEGFTNYLVYGPMEETNWGFFVGFYGDTLSQYIQKIASNSTASSQLFILTLFVLMAILAVYTNYNLRKEKSYTKELLRQKQEIQQQAEELAISEERFRIALERTSNIIFEYNFQTGNITNFRRTKEVVHYETSCKHLKDCLVLEGVIDDESVRLLEHSLHDILDGMPKSECVIKAFLADGTIVWYRVSITSVSNQGQQPTRVIGILEDITKEKLAELDPLTGVFNKKVFTEQILACLQRMGKDDIYAFLMFDIDNFKVVNDTYGHPVGDQVIIQVAGILKNTFSQNAFVGRVGGDEFCVFCYGFLSTQKLKEDLANICSQIHSHFLLGYETVPITYSCGVAFGSGKNKSFETLYQEADDALYSAKNAGKNQYRFNIKDDE